MQYMINIMQGEDLHTYFTDAIKYTAVPVDDGTKVVMLECVPQNGHQRDSLTWFPLHRIVSVTEQDATT